MTAPLPIGAATLDAAARTLTGPGGDARLTPQPLRLLVRLAERAGRVVSYPDLIAALHDRYGRADAETVRNNLRHVRTALRESGAGVAAETVSGIGACLREPVRVEAVETPAPPVRRISPRARPAVADAVRALQDAGRTRVEIMRALGLTDAQMTHLGELGLVRFAAARGPKPEPSPAPDPVPAVPVAAPAIVVDAATAARWAAERGLAHHARRLDLDAVNAKRRALGLPPFALRPGRGETGEVRP